MRYASINRCYLIFLFVILISSSPLLKSDLFGEISLDFSGIIQNKISNPDEIQKESFFQNLLEYFLGSGLAIALFGGFYLWFVKGKIKIVNYCDKHEDTRKVRFRFKVKNKKFKTLKNLCCYVSFLNLNSEDLALKNQSLYTKIFNKKQAIKYIITRDNYVPIKKLYLNWAIGEKVIELHPRQTTEVNFLCYLKQSKEIEIASEFGYEQARARIVTLREFFGYIQFFAEDYKSPEFYFRVIPDMKNNRIFVEKMRKNKKK